MKKEPKKKAFSFGTCDFARTSPPLENLNGETVVLNVEVPFEDALQLNLAIDECIRRVNSYNRSTTAGKRAGVGLAVHLKTGRISVYEARLPRVTPATKAKKKTNKKDTLA